jgi:hypothetical protein
VEGTNINAIAAWLNLDDHAGYTLRDVGQRMGTFVDENPGFFADFVFVDMQSRRVVVAPAQMKTWLQSHFVNMDAEANICPSNREVWSRSWSLAFFLAQSEHSYDAVRFLYDAVVENYATGGGCIQGRVNRGLIAYTRILGSIGLLDF